ncbi:GSCOCG00000659001-RA-CDS [Cotesia congregata]|nr:GSCOCG00000659001-RA-CDS [Cotesia congregata]
MIKKKAVNSELWGHRPNDLWTLAFLREGELPQSTTTIHSTNTTMLHPIPFQHRRRQVPTSRIFPLFHSLCPSGKHSRRGGPSSPSETIFPLCQTEKIPRGCLGRERTLGIQLEQRKTYFYSFFFPNFFITIIIYRSSSNN